MKAVLLAAILALAGPTQALAQAAQQEPVDAFNLADTPAQSRGTIKELPQGAGWVHYDPDGWYNVEVLQKNAVQPGSPPEGGFKYTYEGKNSYTMLVITKKPLTTLAKASAEALDGLALAMNAPNSSFAPQDLAFSNRRILQVGNKAGSKRPVSMATWEGSRKESDGTIFYVVGIVPTRKGLLYAHCFSEKSIDFCRLVLSQGLILERGAF